MPLFSIIRRDVTLAIAGLALMCVSGGASAQPGAGQHGGMRGGGNSRPPTVTTPHSGKNQEHLPQWMARHSEMPLAEQQKALESEPGFHDLPSETQQRLR